MAINLQEAQGVLREVNGKWVIELTENFEGLSDTSVKVLFWRDSKESSNEIEEIATVQQLELAVVAEGLRAEGSLASDREAFLKALTNDSSFAL